ncbi:unnamed protein product, partial [Protopolystoma xenopodis]
MTPKLFAWQRHALGLCLLFVGVVAEWYSISNCSVLSIPISADQFSIGGPIELIIPGQSGVPLGWPGSKILQRLLELPPRLRIH